MALLCFALPAGALGAGHFYRQPASVDAEVHLRGTNGFRFIGFAFGNTAILSASKRVSKFGDESVDYFARGHYPLFHDGLMTMNFGGLGQFRARFVAKSTKSRNPAKGCTGDPTTIESGFFLGSFSFHGERGYSSVHSHREPGSVTRLGATRCPIPAEFTGHEGRQAAGEAKESNAAEFRLLAGDIKAQVVFQASREAPPGLEGQSPTSFDVSASGGKVGAFDVSRSAFVFEFPSSAASTFQVPNLAKPLGEAILEPPAPFSGAATFHLDSPKSASWTGDLAVELPGLGKLPLTGGKIAAGLCQGRSHCTKTLPEPLQRLLEGSGGDSSSYGALVTQEETGSNGS
jgi:hypothetical protein